MVRTEPNVSLAHELWSLTKADNAFMINSTKSAVLLEAISSANRPAVERELSTKSVVEKNDSWKYRWILIPFSLCLTEFLRSCDTTCESYFWNFWLNKEKSNRIQKNKWKLKKILRNSSNLAVCVRCLFRSGVVHILVERKSEWRERWNQFDKWKKSSSRRKRKETPGSENWELWK